MRDAGRAIKGQLSWTDGAWYLRRGGLYNPPMLRHLRSGIFWLALAALSLRGFAAIGLAWPEDVPLPMEPATASVALADPAAQMQMVASTAGVAGQYTPGCPSDSGCVEPMTGHCMVTSTCSPFLGVFGSSITFGDFKAALPAVAPPAHPARFLTGAPERPPRLFA